MLDQDNMAPFLRGNTLDWYLPTIKHRFSEERRWDLLDMLFVVQDEDDYR